MLPQTRYHILNSSGSLSHVERKLSDLLIKSLDEICQYLPIDKVDVVVVDNPHNVIPELGIGGYTNTAHLVFIYVDSRRPELETILETELPSTLAHELHHVARWQSIGYGETLLEAMISEGLADHFEDEIYQTGPRPWDRALSSAKEEELLSLAEGELHSRAYSHHDWFFGSSDRSIPRWTAYTLGYSIVDRYLQAYPNSLASKLYSEPANNFLLDKRP